MNRFDHDSNQRTPVQALKPTTVFLATLLVASTAHASDVDILFPLRGLFVGLLLLAVLVAVLPLAPIAALAGLYALFGERRKALGLGALLLSGISLAAVVVVVQSHERANDLAAIAVIAVTLPAAWILLARGMIRHWTSAKTTTAGVVGLVIWGVCFVGEVASYWVSTTPAPPVHDAFYAARKCNGLSYRCYPLLSPDPFHPIAQSEMDRKVDDCVATLPVCRTSKPWEESEECCAATCLASYVEERASPSPARMAIQVAFDIAHECQPGVRDAYRARGYVPEPIRGRRTKPTPDEPPSDQPSISLVPPPSTKGAQAAPDNKQSTPLKQ
jgi:hypothetical protein